MGTGCGRGRQVPQWSASSTTRPSARLREALRCTSNRYGPKRAWSSHTPRPQNRQVPRAAFAQNQHSTDERSNQLMVGMVHGNTLILVPFSVAGRPAVSVAVTSISSQPPSLVLVGDGTGPIWPK